MSADRSVREVVLDGAGHSFSRAVRTGDILWLSGVTPPRDLLQRGATAGEQARACFQRLSSLLQQAGSSLADVARVTVYLTDAADFQEMDAAFREFFPHQPPARTTVVAGLVVPGARIEVEAVAALRRGDSDPGPASTAV